MLSSDNSARINNSIDEDELNLGQIAAVLRRRLLLIVGITTVVATAALLKAETNPSQYLGTFSILTRPVTGESKVIDSVPQTINAEARLSESLQQQQLLTSIAVLQSPRVLTPVVEKLQAQHPDLIKQLQAEYPDFLSGNLTSQQVTHNLYSLLVTYLNVIADPKQPDIINVQFVYSDPQLVSVFSKLLAEAYLQYSLDDRQSDVNQAINFVDQQKQPLEQRVKFWQNNMRDLRLVNSLIEPAQKSQELSSQIVALRQEKLQNRVQLEQLVAKYKDLQMELTRQPGERAGNSVLSENARYQKVLDQIQAADIAMKLQSVILTDENPIMLSSRQKKSALLPLLAQEEERIEKDLQSRIRDLSARDQSLDEKTKNVYNDIRNLANVTRNYENIQRELQIANQSLTQFTAKQQALQIEKAQKQQSWLLLDPQLNTVNQPSPVSKGLPLYLALGSVLGLLAGVGGALLVDKLSNIFYSAKELKDTTRLPLLGIVPARKEFEKVATQGNLSLGVQQPNRISFFEVFRSLYTNILLLGSDSPIRSMVISSAGKGDGKSTIALQLAQAAAAMGQKVLLVDANLRSPILHNRVGLMNTQGLTDIISQDLDWHNVIQASSLEENLFVMTAGAIPGDSIRLLASRKMHDLMDDLQASFDLVIYDTPPLLGFADAYLLGSNTNGIVLVAGLGKLKRTALQQVLEEIQISSTPLLGMIANKSKEPTAISNNYYQQYSRRTMIAERVGEGAETNNTNSSISSDFKKIRRR